MNLSWRKKRKYFENLDFNLFSDNKMFWNSQESNNIMQTKRRKVITITMKNVQIRSIQSYWCHKTNKTASEKYKRHPNVLEIKEKTKIKNQFRFKPLISKDIKGITKDKKNTQKDDFPVKGIKGNIIYFSIIRNI